MRVIICTLFENDYHFGVAALANSLYHKGFRGTIYAGYRGALPSWTNAATCDEKLRWKNNLRLEVQQGLDIYFLPLTTDYHLTNYKPDFMLTLMNEVDPGLDGIIYMDPDIVSTAPWRFYEEWLACGICVCEDVNSPIPEFHPRRIAWRKYFGKYDLELKFKSPAYVNGGFVGLKRDQLPFLEVWKKIQEFMGLEIGGLGRSIFSKGDPLPEHLSGDFAPFGKTDQDALNAAIEAFAGQYSVLGRDGMSFSRGIVVMSHALGSPKPWNLRPIKSALAGRPPTIPHKDFWAVPASPIPVFSRSYFKKMNRLIKAASFIGRFYKKN